MWRRALIAAGVLLTMAVAAGDSGTARAQTINPADFSPVITNPLFPISAFTIKVFEGRDDGDEGVVRTRLESRTLPRTEVVAGVTVTVLQETAFEDGEIVEVAHDFFAQHRNGDVYYFGETVDNYEDGKLLNHNGAWRAGDGRNEPGIQMLASPTVGRTYKQEFAPGIAEDVGTIVAVNESVKVPAGSFTGCVKIKDTTPLEPGLEEFKWFCPGIGMVKEEAADGFSELVSFERATPAATPTPGAISQPNISGGVQPLTRPEQASAPATPTPGAPAAVVRPPTGDGGLLVRERRQDTATQIADAFEVGSKYGTLR